MTLKLERSGAVIILVPEKTPKEEIHNFFQSRVPWIHEKLTEYRQTLEKEARPKSFIQGEKFLYLGEEYPLEITQGPQARLILSRGVFDFIQNDHADKKQIFIRWYKKRAQEVFTERVPVYAGYLGLTFKSIRITSARTRYGSCSYDDRLSFSYRLVMAPYHVIDYIIIHELAHTAIKNHSKDFWDYVERILPDYKESKNWLKIKGHLLDM